MTQQASTSSPSGFWGRLPVAVQAIVALMGAVAALITALAATGLIGGEDNHSNVVAEPQGNGGTASPEGSATVGSRDDTTDAPSDVAVDKPLPPQSHNNRELAPRPTPGASTPAQPPLTPTPSARNAEYPHRAILGMSRVHSVALMKTPEGFREQIASVPQGIEFAVGKEVDGWFPARLATGETGWIRARQVLIIEDD